MRFVEIAARVDGAPQPDPTQLQDDDATDADAVAAYRLKSNSNGVVQLLAGGAGGAAAGAAVGSAAAYGTFVAVASFGTASTGAAISGLSGVAATNATLALLAEGRWRPAVRVWPAAPWCSLASSQARADLVRRGTPLDGQAQPQATAGACRKARRGRG